MSALKERVDRLILSHTVQPVRHNPPGKIIIDTSVAFSLCEIWTKVYSPEPGAGLTFPQTVHRLSELGVTRYRVDFVTNTAIAYIGGSAHLYHFPTYATEEIIPGTIPWSLVKLRDAIKKAREDAKNLKPDLPTYTRQIVQAGVCDYTCFIEGRRVTYSGYLGEQHSAWFMGAGSDAPINSGIVRRNTATGHGYTSKPDPYHIPSSPLRRNIYEAASETPRLSNMNYGAVIRTETAGFDSKNSINSSIATLHNGAVPTPASNTIPTPASGVAPTITPDAAPTPVSDAALTTFNPASMPALGTFKPAAVDTCPQSTTT